MSLLVSLKIMKKADEPATGRHESFSVDIGVAAYFQHLSAPHSRRTLRADACALSRASALRGKAISKQTFAILPKIREIDDLLQTRTELRPVVREVHPEVSFAELVGNPMIYRKSSVAGREERRTALSRVFQIYACSKMPGVNKGCQSKIFWMRQSLAGRHLDLRPGEVGVCPKL